MFAALSKLRTPLHGKFSRLHGTLSKIRTPLHRKFSRLHGITTSSISPDRFVYSIIGVNCLVFGFWYASGTNYKLHRFMWQNFTLSDSGIRSGRFHTFVTCCFSHQNTFHLASNMITLFFFGPEVVATLGIRNFCLLYLGSGMASSMCQFGWLSHTPQRRSAYILGASGALNSVLAYSIFQFPTRIIYLYGVLPLPAAIFGGFVIASDAFGLVEGSSQGVGNMAHLSGAAIGALYFLKRCIRR